VKDYNFEFEISSLVTMFIAAIDEGIVKRYNQDKQPKDQILPRFVYSPKQRVLLDLLDKAQNIQLPVVAVYITGISWDQNRVYNKIAGSHYYNNDSRYLSKMAQPLPIDVNVNVVILTRYQLDCDQLISNIIVNSDPYFVISWRIPSMSDYEIRTPVYWNGNVNITYPQDINSSNVARVQAEMGFTIKGWLFKSPNPDSADGRDAKIYKIVTDFSSLSALTTRYTLSALNPLNTERFVIDGLPQPQIIQT
jgi:hypothetical protein